MSLRIVQVLTQGRGGPVDHAADVAAAFARLGHESHVVGPAGEYVDRLVESGARWHRVEVGHKLDTRGAREVGRLLTRLEPDVVHGQDRRAGMVGRLWAWRHRVPSVYTLHGVPDSLAELVPGNRAVAPRRRSDRLAYLTAERQLARVPRSAVVVPCGALGDYAHDHVGVPAERIRVVTNGIPERWLTAPRERTAAEAPLAVWLGLMAPVKRVESLVEAVAGVPGLRLRLVGDGPLRERIEALGARLGSRLELTGFAADPLPLLAEGDLFVLPSAAEACPIALLQAMALGLACVATRVGGVPDLVRDGVDGVLVDAGDDAALRAALAALAADPARRASLGASARARVEELFTAERCARLLIDVYEEVTR
jgi:glycosyltransferase involved in cell wall biosynthesis